MADLRGYVEGLIGFEGDGTNVVANPTGTPTDNLETVQIGETIYNVGGGGESIVPTPTNVDRGKYLGVKSNANELEYRSINELPNSEGASAGTVLTHTISGDSWLPPAKELPAYSTVQNDKVLGVHNGALEWVEQSGGGSVVYSTEEQVVGTWIDGRAIYEKTYYLPTQTGGHMVLDNSVSLSNADVCFLCSMSYTFGGYINGVNMGYEIGLNSSEGVFIDFNHAINPFGSGLSKIYITVRYVKLS